MAEYFEAARNKGFKNDSSYVQDMSKSTFANDPRERQRALKLFKDMIGASVNFALKDKSCCNDDSFLYRFLYARKFDCEAALELLINYLSYKEQNNVVLKKINIFDEQIQISLKDGNPGVLSQRDRKGRKVVTFQAANWDASKYNQIDVYRAFLLTLDKLLENVHNQALGVVVIVDWTNFNLKQSTNLSPKTIKLMIEGLQECMPVKFKGIHFISQPWYVDIALAVMKPFLDEKIKKRFYVHGTNLTSLHNLISKDILPPELGGEGPSTNPLDWYHYLLASSQSESPKSYRLIEAAVYSTAPRTDDSPSAHKKQDDYIEVNTTNNFVNS